MIESKIKWRRAAVGVAALLLVSLFEGCGSSAGETEQPVSPEVAAERSKADMPPGLPPEAQRALQKSRQQTN